METTKGAWAFPLFTIHKHNLPSNEFPSGKFGEPSPSPTLKNYRLQQVLRHWNPGLNQNLVEQSLTNLNYSSIFHFCKKSIFT